MIHEGKRHVVIHILLSGLRVDEHALPSALVVVAGSFKTPQRLLMPQRSMPLQPSSHEKVLELVVADLVTTLHVSTAVDKL